MQLVITAKKATTQELRETRRKNQLGKKYSDETKRKMSESHKKKWQVIDKNNRKRPNVKNRKRNEKGQFI